MRSLRLSVGVVALTCFAVAPVLAGQRGNSGNHGPSTHGPSTHGPSTHGPSTHGPSTHGPSSSGPSTKSTGSGSHGPSNAGSSAKNTGGGSSKHTTTTTTSTTGTQTVTTAGSINFASTSVGQKLTRNTALQSKLTTKLTALGYTGTVFEAAYGFKNLGQFVAATNVSQNLGIPFEQLKLQMTGLTVDAQGNVLKANLAPNGTITLVDPALATSPAPTKSLGQSIQTLKPTADANTLANTATVQAETEIEHSTTTTTTSTSVSKNGKKKS
jgi:hypothetical protein